MTEAAPTIVFAPPVTPTTVIDDVSEKFRTAVSCIERVFGTSAHQISAVPRCTFARAARVHVNAPPAAGSVSIRLTVVLVPVAGASVETNATSSVLAATENDAVVLVVFGVEVLCVVSVVIVGALPDETTRFTALPGGTDAPAAGDSLITVPAATVVLPWNVTVPTVRPAPVSDVPAAAWLSPTTFGTRTFGGPLETTRFTAVPTSTAVAAAGSWLMTTPAGTVALLCCVIVPGTRPDSVSAVSAVPFAPFGLSGNLVTAGTVVPIETTRLTAVPGVTVVPSAGLALITRPMWIVELVAVVIVPTVRPAFTIAFTASACSRPTTPGTVKRRPGTGTVTSENCSCSMLRSVSVPVPRFGLPAGGPLSTIVTVPFGFRMIEYSDSGFANTAVSQLRGWAGPQSAGGVSAGVTMLRMMLMLPGFSRCGFAKTSSTSKLGSSTSLMVPSFITARSWTCSQTSPSIRSSPALPSSLSLPLPPSRMSPPMKPTPLTSGIAGSFRFLLNPAGPISCVRPAIFAAPDPPLKFTWPGTPIAGVDTGGVPAVSSIPTIRHSATSPGGVQSTLSDPAM